MAKLKFKKVIVQLGRKDSVVLKQHIKCNYNAKIKPIYILSTDNSEHPVKNTFNRVPHTDFDKLPVDYNYNPAYKEI